MVVVNGWGGMGMTKPTGRRTVWRATAFGLTVMASLWPGTSRSGTDLLPLNIIMAGNSLNNFPALLARRAGYYTRAPGESGMFV